MRWRRNTARIGRSLDASGGRRVAVRRVGVRPDNALRWEDLRGRIKSVGLRNSLLIAIAPTATIASIVGCCECIEPQVSNLFKRETLSGDFLQMNRYLITELKRLNLWNEGMRNRLKISDGSVQGIGEIPEEIRAVYRTAWDSDAIADRYGGGAGSVH